MTFPVEFSLGLVSKFFGVWLLGNLALSLIASDRRLRNVSLLFISIWLITSFPHMELIASPLSFLALTRFQVRRPDERDLCWWMVPLITAEVGIFASQLILLLGDYVVYWSVMQVFFVVQLVVISGVGLRLAGLRVRTMAIKSKKSASSRPFTPTTLPAS
ncbi:MAG: hypothetical protein ACKVS5_05390 [Parvularculaceae bacterium]